MSARKSRSAENNENLCPVVRKRSKFFGSKKVTKFESASSPSELTSEYLEEMGIGMLDSEESSSSAASAITLAISTSTDENSNEATPNSDAPKFCHQRMTYRAMDNPLDTSTESGNNSTFLDPNETIKQGSAQKCNNNSFEIFSDEEQHQQRKMEKLQPKKMSAGVSLVFATSASNSNSNSPTNGRNTRSPLATVSCNNFNRKTNNSHQQSSPHQQQQLQQQQQQLQHQQGLNAASHNMGSQASVSVGHRANSPCLPSTSQQAALVKQQHHLQQLQLQKQQWQQQQMKQQQLRYMPGDNFFLFRNQGARSGASDGRDHFSTLSDEIILQIFKWLSKKTLIRCSYVCRRFNRCANDESLWTRLDLGGRSLRPCALENILPRGVVILRLAQAEINNPAFDTAFLHTEPRFESKLQYLDLSMVSITKPSLKMLLSCCRQLKKLSLEHVPINDEICNAIARNTNLEALNLTMCLGLEAWSVRHMMESLKNLHSLNISWTNLSVDAVTSLVTNLTPNIIRLNIAGCRKTMFDSHLASLAKRCPQLLELDLSDCTGLTASSINILCKFKMLEYLSLSRCYLIPPSSYMTLSNMPTLTYLDVFGMLTDAALEMLEQSFPNLGINKFIHSSVARPTVGTRRTSVWGLRTRD